MLTGGSNATLAENDLIIQSHLLSIVKEAFSFIVFFHTNSHDACPGNGHIEISLMKTHTVHKMFKIQRFHPTEHTKISRYEQDGN